MPSIDGQPLLIDELKGTKPVEAINFSNKGLGVASSIIIATCIKSNSVLKELKYAIYHLLHHLCHCPLTTYTCLAPSLLLAVFRGIGLDLREP